ncbi:MAG: endonuclease III [Firmicutes bacterium]|nr:endonuclease III [Bacillota bacterium]
MGLLTKKNVRLALDLLGEMYPDAGCELQYHDPYQLLVAVVLSAQTTDKRVNMVTEDLFRVCPGPAEMAAMEESELQERIRSIGMYRTKAANVIKLSRMLMEKYDGAVPAEQDLLEELPGVGRKSANVVLSVAFGQPRIAVDTHVFRVANRIGLVQEKNVLDTEKALMKRIPEAEWTVNHHRLIWHGRRVCAARKPACESCLLDGICKKNEAPKKD